MSYFRFQAYNGAGGAAWVGLMVFGGYFFGLLIPEGYFVYVTVAIILISLLPMAWEVWRGRREMVEQQPAGGASKAAVELKGSKIDDRKGLP